MSLPREYIKLLTPKSANSHVKEILDMSGVLHTVCEEALCPNRGECFKSGTATFLIMGNICTRDCAFCSIKHGKPEQIDKREIEDIVHAVHSMNLRYVVITSVTRDDLTDGGAFYFNAVARRLKAYNKNIIIEMLIPDFKQNMDNLKLLENNYIDVLNHNIETSEGLYNIIRKGADYRFSLSLLKEAKKMGFITKSGIMLGVGEDEEDIKKTINDIQKADVDILTIGQYIKPLKNNYDVKNYYSVDEYQYYGDYAHKSGIRKVISGVFVRSSYNAYSAYKEIM